ncbi:MAG: class I SAM-dependent methyltransferase [Anaerolineae bacterium]
MDWLNRFRRETLTLAFHLFYNQLAWTYDVVSWAISRGRWSVWQRAALPRLRGKRVLEVAFGTGNLLLELIAEGYETYGLDLSRSMIRIAIHKLRRHQVSASLSCGRVQALPFPDQCFDSIVVTFPAPFIHKIAALRQMWRTLTPEGRLVIVDGAVFHSGGFLSTLINFAFRFSGTGQGLARRMALLEEVGFSVKEEWARDDISAVKVMVAEK